MHTAYIKGKFWLVKNGVGLLEKNKESDTKAGLVVWIG